MKVTIVFPANRAIPSGPYSGLPLLAGCLGAAGHQVDLVDANLEVFERMIRREYVERCRDYFDANWARLKSKSKLTAGEARELQGMATIGVVPFDHLLHAQRAGEVLRDLDLFLDVDRCLWAYDVLANYLRLVNSQTPVFQPLSPNYNDDLYGYLKSGATTPVSQIQEAEVIDLILAQDPELVALSIPFNEQTLEAMTLLAQIKRRAPHVKTIVGGSIVSSFHKILCTDPRFYEYADFAMIGESDESFPEFVTGLERGDFSSVVNLYHRDAQGTIVEPRGRSMPNLNAIPKPDFSRVPVSRYFLPRPVINYQTSRGCYYGKCTFCSDDLKASFRFRKADLVIGDIEHIREQTGVRHLMFWDPLTPPRLMRDIAKWNSQQPEDQRFYWGAETKFEKLFTKPEFTDLLYQGGARWLTFGFESGSQRVLDLMVKGNDLQQLPAMLHAMRDSGIKVSVSWFIGFPGATEAEDIQSYRYLDEHRDSVLLSAYIGKFALSPDDDIMRSGGDMYDIDLFQEPDGRWDFRHRDGRNHYDREELDAAMLSRGDAESVARMHFYVYLTEKPELAPKLSNFERGGILPESWNDLAGTRPVLPSSNHLRSYDFDIFTAPQAQGLSETEARPLPNKPCHALLVTQTQVVYSLSEAERQMVLYADGTRTVEQILDALPGDRAQLQKRLFGFVRRGVLVVPLPQLQMANA